MDKRILLANAGIVAVVAVIWLATRNTDPLHVERTPAAVSPTSVVPEATPDGPAATAASEPAVAAVTQTAVLARPQASAEALPIDVSPGNEFLTIPAAEMKDTDGMWSNWRRHQQLQSESRDEAWSPRIETSLRGVVEESLTSRGLDTRRIELSVVECRTSGCEIQAVGYPEDNRKEGVDLQLIMFQMLGGNLGNEFDRDQVSITLTSRQDQRIGFLVFLPRKKP